MLRKFMRDKVFCGLDVGARSIKAALLVTPEGEQAELMGVFETKTNGFSKGSISNLADLTECIQQALNGLMQKAGVKCKEVHLGMGGELILVRNAAAVIPLMERGTKVIVQADVKKVLSQAKLLGVKMEEIVLHDFPQYYKVDDMNTALNPLGLYGRKIEVKSMLILMNSMFLRNLTKAVNQAGFDVLDIAFSTFCSGEASLMEQQKKAGCVLIDIGATVTSLAIYQGGSLKYLDHVLIGGDHITKAISDELKLSFDLAESLKQSYAFASRAESWADEEILIKREDGYIPIRKELIIQAIEPTIGQLVQAVLTTLRSSELQDQVNSGVIMVGGGSLLPGLLERIEQDVHLPVKLGKVNIAGHRLQNAAKYAAAVGLAQCGAFQSRRLFSQKDGRASFPSYFAGKLKEMYQEYF